MNFVLNKLIGSLEELSSQDDHGGGAISYLTVLDLRKFDENLGSWVLNLELLQDSGSIVSDSNIADIIH
jgi:hypothetical protein